MRVDRGRWSAPTVLAAIATVIVWVVGGAAVMVSGAAAAPASTPLNYAVNGTLLLPDIKGTGAIGPGTLSGVRRTDGTVSATIAIPPVVEKGLLLGFIPVTVTNDFATLVPATGTLKNGEFVLDVTASIKIRSVSIAGVPAVDPTCRPVNPTLIHLASDGTGRFAPSGGRVTSSFKLGPVTGCGVLTPILSALLSSANHTLTLDLTTT